MILIGAESKTVTDLNTGAHKSTIHWSKLSSANMAQLNTSAISAPISLVIEEAPPLPVTLIVNDYQALSAAACINTCPITTP
ncbi:MAG: hypothetical protein RLZZ69_3768, partial [Cyanobacteriota bacterium]